MLSTTILNNKKSKESKNAPRVLAVTGGKGGVGKTSIAVNLAIALSRKGSRVCLFDADTALGNINIMLGIHPAYTLEHLFSGEKSIKDILIEGPESIRIVPGASGAAQCADLDIHQQQRLVASLQSLEPDHDYMIVDTAAGISPTVLHFVAAAQVATVVITPEPTSLTDAFSLLKVLKRRGYRRGVQVIVNMVPSSVQAEKVFRRFSSAVAKYLDMSTEYLGSVWMDESMRTAVTLQRPVALFPKNDPSARSFYRLAERIDGVFGRPGVPKLAFSAYWKKVVERQLSKIPQPPIDHEVFENPVPLSVVESAVSSEAEKSPSSVSKPKQLVGTDPISSAASGNSPSTVNVSVPEVVSDKLPVHCEPIRTLDETSRSSEALKPVLVEKSASFPVLEKSNDSPSTATGELVDIREQDVNDTSSENSPEQEADQSDQNPVFGDKILELAEKASHDDIHSFSDVVKSIDQNLSIESKVDQQLSQVEKQLAERRRREELAEQLASLSGSRSASTKSESVRPLDEKFEKEWLDLRHRLNKFFSNPLTTPEQATTLLSSCIYNSGDKLGGAAVDLLHGLMSSLKSEDLSAEQKLLLRNDYERLALNGGRPMVPAVDVAALLKRQDRSQNKSDDSQQLFSDEQGRGDDSIQLEPEAKYDQEGFGCQNRLAEKIRSSSDLSLENLLESVKYASLVDSSQEDVN